MHKIEAELIKATKFKAKNKTGQRLLQSLVEAVQKLSDEEWETLSDAAQRWTNDGVEAIQAGKPIPKFGKAEPEDDEEDEDEPAPPKAKKSKKPKKQVKATKGSKVSKPKATGVVGVGPNMNTMLKQLVLRNPKITNPEIMDALRGAGFEPTTFFIATAKSTFKHALRVIKQEGIDVRKLEV